MYGEGDIRVVQKKASREERGNGSGIRCGSLRITSPVPPSSGILRGSDQKWLDQNKWTAYISRLINKLSDCFDLTIGVETRNDITRCIELERLINEVKAQWYC